MTTRTVYEKDNFSRNRLTKDEAKEAAKKQIQDFATYPEADTSVIRQITIHFWDSVTKKRGKPHSVHGAEIRWAIGDNVPDHEPLSVAVWSYTGTVDTPIAGPFEPGKPCKVVITLTAKTGFTLTGIPANAFAHRDSTGISNDAGGGAITITFAGAAWSPLTVSYPSLADKTVNICCYPNTNNSGSRLAAGSVLIDGQSQSSMWDYGWNGNASSNLSDWANILKNAEGVDFTGDECGHGHPTVFLAAATPEAIRKRAHCFTLDLGEVTSGIVSFGIYPRTNESSGERGQRWPIQFEVFYSDSEIGAIPGEEAVSLGIFEWGEAPDPWAWRDVDLYPRTGDGRAISARYIHVRIYAEAKNGVNSEWVCPSFAGIRVGVGTDS